MHNARSVVPIPTGYIKKHNIHVSVVVPSAGKQPNYTLKLSRPGFDPALKRLGRT